MGYYMVMPITISIMLLISYWCSHHLAHCGLPLLFKISPRKSHIHSQHFAANICNVGIPYSRLVSPQHGRGWHDYLEWISFLSIFRAIMMESTRQSSSALEDLSFISFTKSHLFADNHLPLILGVHISNLLLVNTFQTSVVFAYPLVV